VQSQPVHISVQFNPLIKHIHLGSLQPFEHLQYSKSSKACGAGRPSIQSIVNCSLPSIIINFQPLPLGVGVSGCDSKLLFHIAD